MATDDDDFERRCARIAREEQARYDAENPPAPAPEPVAPVVYELTERDLWRASQPFGWWCYCKDMKGKHIRYAVDSQQHDRIKDLMYSLADHFATNNAQYIFELASMRNARGHASMADKEHARQNGVAPPLNG